MESAKLIAYYLPQYHPIPENDRWWAKGFTEWSNVSKARPLFKNHYQPRFPADLGYYDLRLPEVRDEQAALAAKYGIYGFCYYHYWFGNGKRLLERPFNEVLASGKPALPFMLCWANQTWKGVWFGASKGRVLIEQMYPGKDDYLRHFNCLVRAFTDPRYIRIEDKPVFNVYMPLDIPDLEEFVNTFRECAYKAGLKGLYLLGSNCPDDWNPLEYGFDGVIPNEFGKVRAKTRQRVIKNKKLLVGKLEGKVRQLLGDANFGERRRPVVIPFRKAIEIISNWQPKPYDSFPLVIPDWDNSARAENNALILHGSTPALWKEHLERALQHVKNFPDGRKIVFIKSWNEWAEGNYLEPDGKWGSRYLEVVKELIMNNHDREL